MALFLTLLLPGLYIATTTYHQELFPTEFLFAIVASRSNVPFPILFEILTMEISLELIRESGIRVPSPLGQTIGIVRSSYFRRSCCFCKCCESNTCNNCFDYWYYCICCTWLFFKFSYSYYKVFIYSSRIFCWISRYSLWICFTLSNTCKH